MKKIKNLSSLYKYILYFISLTILIFSLIANKTYAKELKIALDADPVSLDIHQKLSVWMMQQSHLLFDPLVRFYPQDSSKLEARLAEKWERLDNKTIRFYLRKGVKFHSGNTFSAKDVDFTFKRLKKSIEYKAIFNSIKEVKIINSHTFDLITEENFPLTLNVATYIFPLDSQFYKDKDKIAIGKETSFASTNASGTGPFIVTERQQGVKTIYTRFKDYWDKNTGNVDKIILTPIAEEQTRVSALLSGGVDFIWPVQAENIQRVEKSKTAELIKMDGTVIIMVQMNQNQVPQFKDKRVRKAINLAINKEGIVKKILRGNAKAAAQISPPSYAGHINSIKPIFDIKKAKKLMKEAGYEKGFTVTMLAPTPRHKFGLAIKNMLAKINIKVDLKSLPNAQFWQEFDKRSANMLFIGWHSDTEDSANFSEFLSMCPDKKTGFGQYNSGNYCNKKLDELTIRAGKETNEIKRNKILQKIEQIVYDDAITIPLFWRDNIWGIKKGLEVKDLVTITSATYLGDLKIK